MVSKVTKNDLAHNRYIHTFEGIVRHCDQMTSPIRDQERYLNQMMALIHPTKYWTVTITVGHDSTKNV